MPETSDHEHPPSQPPELGGIISGSIAYLPTADELAAVRDYLRDIQAAVDLLPELDPTVAGLDAGFDPTWREAPS